MHRETVRSETSNPSFRNSPGILCAPQVGFSLDHLANKIPDLAVEFGPSGLL
jgi:hypothetical protein